MGFEVVFCLVGIERGVGDADSLVIVKMTGVSEGGMAAVDVGFCLEGVIDGRAVFVGTGVVVAGMNAIVAVACRCAGEAESVVSGMAML